MTVKADQSKPDARRLVVGMSGASGIVYGVRVLELAHGLDVETHLVVSKAAEMTLKYETPFTSADLTAKAHTRYAVGDVGAAIASGSFPCLGMIIAPCSVRTMSEIATGVTTTLLTRAADVMLKERRPLVLMVRETPFHLGHLRTMTALTEMGAIIFPPLPAFYAQPTTIEDLVTQSSARALDLVGLASPSARRWGIDVLPGRAAPEDGE